MPTAVLCRPSSRIPVPEGPVTRIVNEIGRGEPRPHDAGFSDLYQQLHGLAAAVIRRRNDGWRLQPAELVSAAYLKVFDHGPTQWENRRHFYGSAANAMRQVLVDLSRKHGPRAVGDAFDLDSLTETGRGWFRSRSRRVPAIDAERVGGLIDELGEQRPRAAEVARLRLFAGLTLPEIARSIPVPLRTAQREWSLANGWLLSRVRRDE